jgi:hypothetical protein
MEVGTIFLGIIAASSVVVAVAFIIIAVSICKVTKSIDDKASIVVYEMANVLRRVRDTVGNVEQVSRVFNVFSFLKKRKSNESK